MLQLVLINLSEFLLLHFMLGELKLSLVHFVAASNPEVMNVLLSIYYLILFVDSTLQQLKSVVQHVTLYLLVERGIAVETGGMVDFKKPGFAIFVKKYVETEDFKAHIAVEVAWLTGSVVM